MATSAYRSSRAHLRARGRHRDPRTINPVRQAVAAGGLSATAFVAAELVAPGVAAAATAEDFAKLRMCESGGNYAINTGNGYYGAYQFSLPTWRGLGYSGYPHQASPAVQDRAARELQARSGWGQWPACSAKLGLYGSSSNSAPSAPAPAPAPARTVTTAAVSDAVVVSAPQMKVLSQAYAGSFRPDVARLQTRLATIGYDLKIDGRYGPKTEGVVREFQAGADLVVDGLAGPVTRKAVREAAVDAVLSHGVVR